MAKTKENSDRKQIARNKRARFEFDLLEFYEAGIVLQGTEVKSLRNGRVALSDGYARIDGEEIYLLNVEIPVYTHGTLHNHEPKRTRKLLMHRREIQKLRAKVQERGFTLVPTQIYFRRGFAKIEIALAKGKTHSDRRQDMKKRDHQREMRQYR